MEELQIPFVLWLSGEARPDLTLMTAPVTFSVTLQPGTQILQRGTKIRILPEGGDDDV
jgi:hypothetical protein